MVAWSDRRMWLFAGFSQGIRSAVRRTVKHQPGPRVTARVFRLRIARFWMVFAEVGDGWHTALLCVLYRLSSSTNQVWAGFFASWT